MEVHRSLPHTNDGSHCPQVLVLVLTEWMYSGESATSMYCSCLVDVNYLLLSTTDSITGVLTNTETEQKRVKATKHIVENYKLHGYEVVFRLVMWKHRTGVDRTSFPENVIVSNWADMQRHISPTLTRMLDAIRDTV
jgi:hypothetical protein